MTNGVLDPDYDPMDPTHLDAAVAADAFPGVHVAGIPLCWLQEFLERYGADFLDDAELAFDPPMARHGAPPTCRECLILAHA